MAFQKIGIAVVDSLACLAFGAATVVALSGGGTFSLGTHTISVHSVGNLLLFVGLWSAWRYGTRHLPFLGVAALPLDNVPTKLAAVCGTAAKRLTHVRYQQGWLLVVALTALLTLLKVAVALSHPGFFSGDDVEVHEMTLGALYGTAWPVWELRSAFYPMTFVFPFQWIAAQWGITDPGQLVAVGRLVVALLSSVTLLLLYRVAARRIGAGFAVVAAVTAGTSTLYVEFGATELPRPIAALLVLGAYAALSGSRRPHAAIAAGAWIGIAACLRFSEAVFLLPALVHMAAERRWRDAATVFAAALAAGTGIQWLCDWLYWGEPFRSARAIVQFTLVDRLSSRGYDPLWYYAREATHWSDLLVIALAIYGSRHNRILAAWVWLPVAALSMLPHKEPRYLIPLLPLLSLLAVGGLHRLLTHLPRFRPETAAVVATALTIALPLRFIDQISGYHVKRSDTEVRFAHSMTSRLSSGPIVAEQAWRFGGQLYFGLDRDVIDVAPGDVAAAAAREKPSLVIVRTDSCGLQPCVNAMAALGMVEHVDASLQAAGYRAFAAP